MSVISCDAASLSYWRRKRVLDVIVAAAALILTAPVVGLASLAIKLETRGPVLFTQVRVGTKRVRATMSRSEHWQLRPFRMYKLRTMRWGADEGVHIEHVRQIVTGAGPDGARSFKIADDRRITRVGRILRRTSADELPQLLNVLLGQMSLVGPRPVPPYEVEMYEPAELLQRFTSPPGLTGLWQVSARGEASFEQMIALDLEYVMRRSIRTDLLTLVRTVPAIVARPGA